jgi:hypothetical protein
MPRESSSRGAFIGDRENYHLSNDGSAEVSCMHAAKRGIGGCVSTFTLPTLAIRGQRTNTDEGYRIGESAALLHPSFPRYAAIRGMNPVSEVGALMIALRSQGSMNCWAEEPLPAIATPTISRVKVRASFHSGKGRNGELRC